MKKIFTILCCLLSMAISAENVKLALLQPLTVPGSTECNPMEISMVRGELRKAFGWQSDFQVLTRMDVDAMLKEQGFQRTGMVDDAQRKEIGKMTSAQYICVSTITKYNTQIYIEAYLVDIETGQMTNPASQYINVKDEDYSTLPTACGELAKEMLGELGGTTKKPARKGSKQIPEGYVDLGLPSGTLWKSENEDCGLINYDQAMLIYGSNLPTREQYYELQNYCTWKWVMDSYLVIGPNGQYITLQAKGFRECGRSTVYNIGITGDYWTSTPSSDPDQVRPRAYALYFCSEDESVRSSGFTPGEIFVKDYDDCCEGLSVRLVK